MPQENREAVERAMDAYNQGDVEGVLEVLDPRVEWHAAFQILLGGEGQVYRGHDGVRRLFRDTREVFSQLEAETAELHDLGDRVCVTGRLRARGRASGIAIESPMGLVMDFKDHKAISVRTFLDPTDALEAAGLRK